jgi:excisionase family DNA binding protein
MASKNYIKTTELAKLTGCPYNEILQLANTGVLSGYKTRRGRWRLKVDDAEKYFGIQIDNPIEADDKSSPTMHTKTLGRDDMGKLICGHTARKYLKCSKAEFENLVNQGHIQAYRDEYMRWKVLKESVLKYAKLSQPTNNTRLIINENHYEEVIERICSAKSSIRIMTANFKRFRLKPTDKQGMFYGTPFIECLMEKAVQGVSVQIICSKPSQSFTKEWMECFQRMNNPKVFEYKFCDRNHAKVFIIDDMVAYVGSANVTKAGLRQDIISQQNIEAGILTEDPVLVSSIRSFFSEIWNGKWCSKSHIDDNCDE